MATVYTQADEDVLDVMRRVIAAHDMFDEIGEHVKIEVLTAWAANGVPLRHGGDRAAAKIRVIDGEERSRGGPDVRILIDADLFAGMSPRTREALFAHEIYHLRLQRHLDGSIKTDPYGRPVIKMIDDDWCINGFQRVAEWYGDASIEVRSYRQVGEMLAQMSLPLGGPETTSDAEADVNRAEEELASICKICEGDLSISCPACGRAAAQSEPRPRSRRTRHEEAST